MNRFLFTLAILAAIALPGFCQAHDPVVVSSVRVGPFGGVRSFSTYGGYVPASSFSVRSFRTYSVVPTVSVRTFGVRSAFVPFADPCQHAPPASFGARVLYVY